MNLAAELADRLLLLAEGWTTRIGPPEDVLDEGLLANVYGCQVSVEKGAGGGRLSVQVVWPET